MSREAYSPPPSQNFGGAAGAVAGTSAFSEGPITQYQCGECASKVQLKKGDPIRCKECGHRVLYKERTKRCVSGFGLLLSFGLIMEAGWSSLKLGDTKWK